MNLFFKMSTACWLGLLAGLISTGLAVYCVVRRQDSAIWRVLFLLAVILSIETLVFRNPAFFYVTSRCLDVKHIGWRPARALVKEVRRFKKPSSPTPLLAVGSSQTGAIYGPYAARHPHLAVFTLSGMGPLDLLLYKDLIGNERPRKIIVTLSDFDIGRKPSLTGAKFAPPQTPRMLAHIVTLLLPAPDIAWSEIQDFIAANTISAYRYQYIFKGILNRLSHRNAAFPESSVTSISNRVHLPVQLASLSELDERWFDLNLVLLDEFFAWSYKNKLELAVVEGHYHPRALSQNQHLHEKASAALSDLCARYPNARYVRMAQLHTPSEDDYRDAYHLLPEPGYELSAQVVSLLDRNADLAK